MTGRLIGGSIGAGAAPVAGAGAVGGTVGGAIGPGCCANAAVREKAPSAQRVEWNLAIGCLGSSRLGQKRLSRGQAK